MLEMIMSRISKIEERLDLKHFFSAASTGEGRVGVSPSQTEEHDKVREDAAAS